MEDLLFEDIKKQIETGFVNQGWVTVFSFSDNFKNIQQGGVYSALVKPEKLDESLRNYNWDLHYGDGRPGFVSYFENNKTVTEYYRFNDGGYEPIIYYREQFGHKDSYLDLSEEFKLYHNLYEDFNSHSQKVYIYIDSNGDEETVVKIGKNEAHVKLKFLKDYISARNLHLLIYFDFMRFNEESLKELNLKELNKNFSSDKYFYNHIITNITDRHIRNEKTQSWIMGKTAIKKKQNYQPSIWGSIEERNNYVDFIIDYDENGYNLKFTCNEDKLANYFGKNPEAPQYVTAVYFKKDVLKKYYDNPSKYSVEDGRIYCNSIWSLRLDNSCKNYVIVLLGDLGKLHYKEQLYWKSFNIAPQESGFSRTGYKRLFNGVPSNPDSADLLLKMKLESFNEFWIKKYGWYLFKPLSKEDFHYYKTLHLLTSSDNGKEFDEQILALTKIFIDSLNEKELIKNIEIDKQNPKGIDKLEAFLQNKNIIMPEMITLFRNVQALRSSTVAHRRNVQRKDTKKILRYFDFENKELDKILEKIFEDFIKTIITLDIYLIKT